MVYHVSATHGLTKLIPKISTHRKPYVYAVENKTTALLFGAKHDDFDFIISTDSKGLPHIYECYPNVFQAIFSGVSCSVYELPSDSFFKGKTNWDAELVSETEVFVQKERYVPDLYESLLRESDLGNLAIHFYQADPDYRKMISEHIVDRMIRFDLLEKDWKSDSRFTTHYAALINGLISLMDGHLLQP